MNICPLIDKLKLVDGYISGELGKMRKIMAMFFKHTITIFFFFITCMNCLAGNIVSANKNQEKFVLTQGTNYALCRDYLALINRVPRNPKNTCGLEYDFDKEASNKGFSAINWIEVDEHQYEKMLLDYWIYSKSIGTDFIKGWKEKNIDRIKSEFNSKFLPVRHWLWYASFDMNNDGKKDSVYKLVSRECTLNKASFFMPSEKGFASTDAGKGIEVSGSVFSYQGRSFVANSRMITEPIPGDGIIVSAEFINPGPAICYFKPDTSIQGK